MISRQLVTEVMVHKSLLVFTAAALTSASQAAVIAATTFDGAGGLATSTMTGIVWTTTDPNGAQVTAGTTATTSAASFKTNGGNPGQFAPDQNLHTGTGFWTGTFSLTVATGFTADLTGISFDFDSRNSSGNLQGIAQIRNIVFDITINGSAYDSQQGGDVTGIADHAAIFTETLSLGEGVHTLVITADGTGPGVFTSIDDLSINGSVNAIPEPSFAALLGLSGLALLIRRRK
jgi:hypothetical protein